MCGRGRGAPGWPMGVTADMTGESKHSAAAADGGPTIYSGLERGRI